MAENPFAPPKADVDAGVPPQLVPRPRSGMPGPVIATVVIVSLLTVLTLVGGGFVAAGIGVLLLIGLLRGNALASQYGVVFVLSLIFSVPGLVFLLKRFSSYPVVLLSTLAPIYMAIPVLLVRRSSRLFFGLQCPKCGAVKARPADFHFTRRRCRACRHEWVQTR